MQASKIKKTDGEKNTSTPGVVKKRGKQSKIEGKKEVVNKEGRKQKSVKARETGARGRGAG